MGNIDLNEIGRKAYSMLRSMKVVPDKDKSELTPAEIEELTNSLQEKLNSSISKLRDDVKHKYEFLSYLYLSVILYLDNMDLNKYITLSVKNNE